jgi:hypothetical protein
MGNLEQAKELQSLPAVYLTFLPSHLSYPISYFLRLDYEPLVVCALVDEFWWRDIGEVQVEHLSFYLTRANREEVKPYPSRHVRGARPLALVRGLRLVPTPSISKIQMPQQVKPIDPWGEGIDLHGGVSFATKELEWWEWTKEERGIVSHPSDTISIKREEIP